MRVINGLLFLQQVSLRLMSQMLNLFSLYVFKELIKVFLDLQFLLVNDSLFKTFWEEATLLLLFFDELFNFRC